MPRGLYAEVGRQVHEDPQWVREGLHALNDRLSSGITLFETRARHDAILDSQITAARYVLCSVIDEAVVTTAWKA